MTVDEEKLRSTTDAMVWAEGFVSVIKGGAKVDEGLMVGWFANFAETVERLTLEAHPERKADQDADFVVLPRAALFEFFGYMALPPWTDEHGNTIGNGIDCAPIASAISEWVAAHDLGDLYRASVDA